MFNTFKNNIFDLLDKNKFFKYYNDTYILSDSSILTNKGIYIQYIIPKSTLYCTIDCKIMQSKEKSNQYLSLITYAKDFQDNVYVNIDKNNPSSFKINAFQSSKGIKINTNSKEAFIQSFNNGLDQLINYLIQKQKDYKALYYISKIAKADPVKYINDFIKKIRQAKFKKSIILQNKFQYDLNNDNYIAIHQKDVLEYIFNYYNDYYNMHKSQRFKTKFRIGQTYNGQIIYDYPKYPHDFLSNDLKNIDYTKYQFSNNDLQITFILCLGEGHLKGIIKYWQAESSSEKMPTLGYISVNKLFKRQGIAKHLLYKMFQYHKSKYNDQVLLTTYFSENGEKYIKNIINNLSKEFNIPVFVNDDYRQYYQNMLLANSSYYNNAKKQQFKNKKYTFQIPNKIKQIVANKINSIISQGAYYLTLQQLNQSISNIYKTEQYKRIFIYFKQKFQEELQSYLEKCLDIYGPEFYEIYFKDTQIIWYQKQLLEDEIQKAKMEDNNVCINQYALIYYLRMHKKQKVYDMYKNLFFIIPHELAHVADQWNMQLKFGKTQVNIRQQNVHSQTFKEQHLKICGHLPYDNGE